MHHPGVGVVPSSMLFSAPHSPAYNLFAKRIPPYYHGGPQIGGLMDVDADIDVQVEEPASIN